MRPTTRVLNVFVILGLTMQALLATTAFAKSSKCTDVGGAILTNIGGFGQIDNRLTTLGVATGDLKGAVGVEIKDGTPASGFTVQHHWVTDSGETLNIAEAHAGGMQIPNTPLFAVTDYTFTVTGGTGRFAKLSGNLSAIGELDFTSGHAILRYSGELCSDKD